MSRAKRKCIHKPTGKIYDSVVELCRDLGFSEHKVRHQIKGRTTNTLGVEYIGDSLVGVKYIERECTNCGKVKSVSEFGLDKGNRVRSCCKKCRALKEGERRKLRGSEWVRIRNIMSAYGVSEPEAKRLRSIWNCECCGIELTKAKSNVRCSTDQVIDHCHETDVVRGVLCSACNLALGHARDSVEVIDKLKEYLIKHKVAWRALAGLQVYLESIK